jgi:hypothetical protein
MSSPRLRSSYQSVTDHCSSTWCSTSACLSSMPQSMTLAAASIGLYSECQITAFSRVYSISVTVPHSPSDDYSGIIRSGWSVMVLTVKIMCVLHQRSMTAISDCHRDQWVNDVVIKAKYVMIIRRNLYYDHFSPPAAVWPACVTPSTMWRESLRRCSSTVSPMVPCHWETSSRWEDWIRESPIWF